MSQPIQKVLAAVAALGAIAFGASALANAASNNGSSSTQAAAPYGQAAPPNGQRPPAGPHRGANGQQEKPLTGETASKVKAAALDKVSGTVERVETDVDHGSPYEAHVRKSDGTEVEVLVNKDFKVTAVNEMQRP